jgi:hypothetical protein
MNVLQLTAFRTFCSTYAFTWNHMLAELIVAAALVKEMSGAAICKWHARTCSEHISKYLFINLQSIKQIHFVFINNKNVCIFYLMAFLV